jgi:hypothetical protein
LPEVSFQQLREVLHGFGEYPAKYRWVVWLFAAVSALTSWIWQEDDLEACRAESKEHRGVQQHDGHGLLSALVASVLKLKRSA